MYIFSKKEVILKEHLEKKYLLCEINDIFLEFYSVYRDVTENKKSYGHFVSSLSKEIKP